MNRAAGLAPMVLAILSASAVAADFPFRETVQPPRRVQVVAHQGDRSPVPENTIAAIEFAIADAVEWIEVDVRLSRDGQHVLIRDLDLDRTTDGSGSAEVLTLAELEDRDAGAKFARRFAGRKIPSLTSALKTAKGRVNLVLNAGKVEPACLVRDVVEAGMVNQVVVVADREILQAVRSAPGGDRIALSQRWKPADGLDALQHPKPEVVEVEAAGLNPELGRALHQLGLKIEAKTSGPNDQPQVWDRLVASGADWIRTDLAEELLAHEFLRRDRPAARVKVAHHRGASRYAPENTLPAYEKSIRLGADLVEFDIRTCRDGAKFLLHDGTLDRTTTGRGPIRNLDAAEVAGLDAGAWFGRPFVGTRPPTLDAFLDAVKDRAELYVDAKNITPEALVATLRDHDLIDRAVVYQSAEYLARLRAIEPRLRRMPPLSDASKIEALAELVAPHAFDTRWGILSKPLIDRCHSLGIKVYSDALGLNESVERYRQAIRDGIDLIQTDHPLRVFRAIEQHKFEASAPRLLP